MVGTATATVIVGSLEVLEVGTAEVGIAARPYLGSAAIVTMADHNPQVAMAIALGSLAAEDNPLAAVDKLVVVVGSPSKAVVGTSVSAVDTQVAVASSEASTTTGFKLASSLGWPASTLGSYVAVASFVMAFGVHTFVASYHSATVGMGQLVVVEPSVPLNQKTHVASRLLQYFLLPCPCRRV